MGTETSVATLLAEGNEAMVEAAFRTCDFAPAEELLTAALAQAKQHQDRAAEAAALDRLGMLMHFRALDRDFALADTAAEEALFQQALVIRREIGDLAGAADSLFGIGLVHQVFGDDWATAMPYYWEALALAEQHAGPLTRSCVHRHVGYFYLVSDVQPERALFHLRMSAELRDEHGDSRWIPGGKLALGEALIATGEREEGVRLMREAVQQGRDVGFPPTHMARMEETLAEASSAEPAEAEPAEAEPAEDGR